MTVTYYRNRAFAQQHMSYQWRRGLHDLGLHITEEMRARAATMTVKDWGLDPAQILDQGANPHCVGFGWAAWGNCPPINDHYQNADGDAIYYEAVAIGGVPNTENGAQTEWGARAMVARRRAGGFAWASSIADIVTWLLVQGPLVTGLVWTQDMADPDTNAIMHAQGPEIGGHETCWVGVDKNAGLLKMANSWGKTWAQAGFSYLSLDDMAKAMANQGDCATAVELSLTPTPTPPPQPSGCVGPFLQALLIAQKRLRGSKSRDLIICSNALQAAADYLAKAK